MSKVLVISFLLLALGCNNKKKPHDNNFSAAKNSIRGFAENHFNSNYELWEGSVGQLNTFKSPTTPIHFDSLISNSSLIQYEQAHLGLPHHKDSVPNPYWTYYQLDEKFNVVSYSKISVFKK